MISLEELRAFKTRFSDENHRIATLLRTQFLDYAQAPILDVGAGLGDISRAAFPDREVVLLDRLELSPSGSPPHHRTIQGDYFDFTDESRFNTLLFSHVLQFLDGDLPRLVRRTRQLAPRAIIVVANTNDDFMGDLIAWASTAIGDVNAETAVPGFPDGFAAERSIGFSGLVRCETFLELARQVHYLLDCNDAPLDPTREFLETRLGSPTFTINQTISAYTPCPTT